MCLTEQLKFIFLKRWAGIKEKSCGLLQKRNKWIREWTSNLLQWRRYLFIWGVYMYVVVQFYHWFNFYFPLCMCLVMYDNKDKIEPQHHIYMWSKSVHSWDQAYVLSKYAGRLPFCHLHVQLITFCLHVHLLCTDFTMTSHTAVLWEHAHVLLYSNYVCWFDARKS